VARENVRLRPRPRDANVTLSREAVQSLVTLERPRE